MFAPSCVGLRRLARPVVSSAYASSLPRTAARAPSLWASRPFSALVAPLRAGGRQSSSSTTTSPFLAWLAALGFGAGSLLFFKGYVSCEEPAERKDLPVYTREEVSKHTTPETRIWVTYKDGVYDITEFVEMHPGGANKIMLAAGRSIDPFWALYQQHNNDNVRGILQEFLIGYLSPEEAHVAADENDPFAREPERHPALNVGTLKPFNAEPPPELLTDALHTPNPLFFTRNHLPVPHVDPKDYRLHITADGTPLSVTLTLDDLRAFEEVTIDATLQCGGNRRAEMSRAKDVRGLSWGVAAISNATWTGVRLRDVLRARGVDVDGPAFQHVQFEGFDRDATASYGASIPWSKAVDPNGDVLLVYKMNGEPLPLDHGFPLRVLVPGTVGARSVKWLSKVILSNEESPSHWQRKDYKTFSPSVDWSNVDWATSAAIQEMPVQSAICNLKDGASVPASDGTVEVKGYAWSGGGKGVSRVDVSADGGATWETAELHTSPQPYNRQWGWTLWRADLPVPSHGKHMDVVVRAQDSACNTQPERVEGIWNLRGLCNNSWHRVRLHVEREEQ
mmetsp:Transcript_19730/g.50088  ORF Transcript_19730/g.50088 Transcript_19730/m.50088 type:complete len:564 (+) Transcript_19730:209-1900(+)